MLRASSLRKAEKLKTRDRRGSRTGSSSHVVDEKKALWYWIGWSKEDYKTGAHQGNSPGVDVDPLKINGSELLVEWR
jgi:hypothetical protein